MMPCFHRDLLVKCLPMLEARIGGWGLDWAWPKAAGAAPLRVAIIDQVAVTHTRPVGGPNYRFFDERGLTPEGEQADILRMYGIADKITRTHHILTRVGLRMSGTSNFGQWWLRASYRLIILAFYIRRDPRRWEFEKRLRIHFSRPDETAD